MKKKKGFTLVELLAVIVILAVILVIAVPQIMSVIESARKGSIESTAKLIAEGAEREYTNRKILGKDTNIKCSDVSSMNSNDYGTCVITFDNTGKATVKVTGKGKFEGYTCNGNSTNMECTKKDTTPTNASYFSYSEVEGGVAITGYNIEGGTDVVIPNEIDGKKVIEIADYAFTTNGVTPTSISNARKINITYLYKEKKEVVATPLAVSVPNGLGITSVVIPNMVKYIGSYAFSGNQLTSVVIPDSVTSVGDSAFLSAQLTNVIIGNGVTSIENRAFQFNQLTNVVIPDSVTSIGYSAFSGNQLTSVTIGNNVTNIGNYAFSGNQLTNVLIPNSVTSIGDRAFDDNQLTSVIIGNNVTSIGKFAFENNQLTEVTIPISVKSIGAGAFHSRNSSNPNLTKIVNKTGTSFAWPLIVNNAEIINGTNYFVTGTVSTSNGNVEVVSE